MVQYRYLTLRSIYPNSSYATTFLTIIYSYIASNLPIHPVRFVAYGSFYPALLSFAMGVRPLQRLSTSAPEL